MTLHSAAIINGHLILTRSTNIFKNERTDNNMKRIKYLTQAEVEKIAKYKIATIGSCLSPVKKIYGTITTNVYGNKYNTSEISIMTYTREFWLYWENEAKSKNVLIELYADKNI